MPDIRRFLETNFKGEDINKIFDVVLRNQSIGICINDAVTLDFLIVNQAYASMLQYTIKEIVENIKNPLKFTVSSFVPDNEKIIAEILREWKPKVFKKTYVKKDGTLQTVKLHTEPFETKDGRKLLLTCVVDVDDLSVSHDLIKDVAEQIPCVIYRWRQKHNLQRTELDFSQGTGMIYMSDRLEELFGIKSSDYIQKPELLSLYPEDVQRWEQSILEAVNQNSTWSFEGRFLRNDGKIIWWRAFSRPNLIEKEYTIFNGVMFNITDEVLRNKEQNSENKQIKDERITRLKNIKTNLSSLFSALGLIEISNKTHNKDDLHNKMKEICEEITKEIDALERNILSDGKKMLENEESFTKTFACKTLKTAKQ